MRLDQRRSTGHLGTDRRIARQESVVQLHDRQPIRATDERAAVVHRLDGGLQLIRADLSQRQRGLQMKLGRSDAGR